MSYETVNTSTKVKNIETSNPNKLPKASVNPAIGKINGRIVRFGIKNFAAKTNNKNKHNNNNSTYNPHRVRINLMYYNNNMRILLSRIERHKEHRYGSHSVDW